MRQRQGIGRLVLLVFAVVMAGCPKPPNQALDDAEEAVKQARSKSECAEDKFRAAERLLEEAKQLTKEKKYDEAERKAKAAAKLAKQAKAKAEANWEDCQKRLAAQKKNVEKAGEEPKESQSAESQEPKRNLELETVYFGYDTADLSDSARQTLQKNLRWMKEHPNRDVVLEGHTDSRGSVGYNLSLGERRARSVKQYLIQLGIDGERLDVLSYGEEKPAAYGDSVSAYRKNRRVEFNPK